MNMNIGNLNASLNILRDKLIRPINLPWVLLIIEI